MARQQYSEDVKAAAMADLMAGEQPAVVAQRYGLPPGTVRQWKNRMAVTLAVTPDVTPHDPPRVTAIQRPNVEDRQARIGSLIIELLQARLEAQLALARHITTNDAWVDKQTASDLASLDGHLHRTAVDVLDRLAGRRPERGNDTDG